MNKLFGKVAAGAIVSLALLAWTSQANAFHHRWHGSSGGSSGGSWGGSSGGWGGSSGGSSGGSWGGGYGHHRHHGGWGGSSGGWGGSSGGWGSSGGSSGGWGSSGGSSGGSYYYSPAPVVDPSTLPVAPPAGGTLPPATVPPAAVPPAGTPASYSDGLLAVSVPEDARIFVNGQPTSSTGGLRQYVSRNLKNGFNYAYEVRAEVVRDGKPVELVKSVNVRAGETAALAFDFPATDSSQTSLTIHVPADAKVYLAGNATKATGETRIFRTTGLTTGKSWDGYTVRVELDRGGKVETKEETISLKAGETREIRFDFGGDKVASSQ